MGTNKFSYMKTGSGKSMMESYSTGSESVPLPVIRGMQNKKEQKEEEEKKGKKKKKRKEKMERKQKKKKETKQKEE